MNDIIEECNLKYNSMYHEINAINASLKITVRDCLIKFAKNLNYFAENFNSLSSDITHKIESLKILNNEEISQSVDKVSSAKNEPRFDKEKLENKAKIEINKEKDNNTEKKTIFQIFLKRKSQNPLNNTILNNTGKLSDDIFEIVSQQKIKNEEEQEKDYEKFINPSINSIY